MPSSASLLRQTVAIIGGGPAGLMAADVLSQAGVSVTLYDAMPSVGRKFLMAGKGGMNISNADPFAQFCLRYGTRQHEMAALLTAFGPEPLREWCHTLGIDTFIGSSGRVFPKDMKAAPLLRAWLHRLRSAGVTIKVRHRWIDWSPTAPTTLNFMTPDGATAITADAVVLALGGGSWGKLGSTGAWVPFLTQQGIAVAPLKPANCGFETNWSDYFAQHFAGHPLKSVAASFTSNAGEHWQHAGECMLTQQGIEGGLIYALSAPLRDTIAIAGSATLLLDLLPNHTLPSLISKLSQPQGKRSFSNHLRKCLGLTGVKAALLRELAAEAFGDPLRLCTLIKALPLTVTAPRPLDEAISSAGGVGFEGLTAQLMLRAQPGVFCAGEMLDWEAPTGGYLLTACFASGHQAGMGALTWLNAQR